ncbi:hypothetical protein L6164_002817 [Bauhinia variegata]|uniref:Uncharacterized protein n=1 Tax=Bauhinia variegata TaxID=167791 RepID=A0ACB9Q205_BAUVA|nr:hypothetical protein L6164_002817 [Bauhinia variegata]
MFYSIILPKVKDPEDTTQFRSISLCNVAYKIIAKRLPNRLKVIRPFIISINQSDFISNCQITDNVLLAYELLHALKTKNFDKEFYLALKHDMSKAYDRMEWELLWAMMAKLGFLGRWINLIMSYVSLVSYSILINDYPQGLITPERRLRQGDPLSLYLFLISADDFSALLYETEREKMIEGVRLCKDAPTISN